MDDSPRRRTGGRAARQAARLASHAEHVPFLTRTLAPFEVLGEEGLVAHRAQRRHDPRGGRPRVPRRPRCAPPVPRGRRGRRRRARPLPARAVPPDRPGDRAAAVHAVRAQPRAQRRDRRHAHGLRAQLRLAVRARPRQRPALRHDRGLPQLREADVRLAVPAPLGRDGLRAGRRAGQQAPPRHGLCPHALQRQAVHGLGHRAGAGARHGRDGPDPVRRRLPRGPHGHPDPDQRQLAARLGRDDARRGAGLRRGQPGDAADAVHPRRRDGAGDRGRRGARRPWPRRSAGWRSSSSSGPARRSCSAPSHRRCRCSRARRRSGRRSRRSCCT